MQKLSPNYRTDDAFGLDPEIRTYLDEHYFKHLPNVETPNPKLLIVFSGGNAIGKSTLARKIGKELGGLVIENDGVKRQILQIMPDIDRLAELNPLIWKYTLDLYARLDSLTPNGLIIRDGVIDWYYDRILPIFQRHGYKLFIIGYDLSREKSLELIRFRGDTPTVKEERLYLLLQDHAIHQKRFRQEYTPDIMLDDDTVFDHDQVIDVLRQHL